MASKTKGLASLEAFSCFSNKHMFQCILHGKPKTASVWVAFWVSHKVYIGRQGFGRTKNNKQLPMWLDPSTCYFPLLTKGIYDTCYFQLLTKLGYICLTHGVAKGPASNEHDASEGNAQRQKNEVGNGQIQKVHVGHTLEQNICLYF